MAQVAYSPVPDIQARTEAPEDYQRLKTSPDMFGAGLAQGIETAGQGAIDASKFYGQVAADNATNTTLQQVGNILYGDPGHMVQGPDGTPHPDTGYFGRRGADAMSAWQDTQRAIDQVIAQNRNGLKTPLAAHQYDTDTRRYRAEWIRQIGAHADEQQRTWAADTNNTAAALAGNDLARDPLNPQTVQDATDRLIQARVKNAQLVGESASGAVLKGQQEATLARIRALVVKDPVNAQKVLDQSGGILGSLPNYDQIAREVKEADINATMAPAIDKAVNEAIGTASASVVASGPARVDPDALHSAFLGQESQNNPNAPVSVNGAHGPGQITPGAFAEFAKPGETIDNPADNRAVSARMLDAYAKRYGGDVARVAVAYFSGPGNVAPPGSATPWIRDARDGNGKSVSSYVADIQNRLGMKGAYPSTADALNATMDATLTKAQADAEKLFPNYPDAQERYVDGVRRRVEQTISQQRQQYDVDTHVVQQAMEQAHPISEDQLIATSPQVAQAWQAMQLNNPYGAMAVQRMFDANAKGLATTYGSEAAAYVDRVLAPSSDPSRISNPAGLYPYVGAGNDAALTNTGVTQLSKLIAARSGPQGEAFAAQAKSFLDGAHSNLTFSAPGLRDQKGEQLYAKFLAVAIPTMLKAQQGGNLAAVLDPKSKDYIGNLALPFMRTPAQMITDRLSAAGQKASVFGPGGITPENLKIAVATGRIPRGEGIQIAQWMGYVQGGAPPSSTPAQPKPTPVVEPMAPPRPGESNTFVNGRYLPEGG